jgi:type I restriction enzyme M protein
VKFFHKEDFAYHKVKVVFWQTDEHDQPAIVTERYEKTFTASNITKEQEFYASELKFDARLSDPDSGRIATVVFTIGPKDNFPKVFEKAVWSSSRQSWRYGRKSSVTEPTRGKP